MALTAKQRLFVDRYLETFNATDAYDQAYEPKNRTTSASNGYRLLRNAEISTAIDERLQESAMRADEVLKRLAEQARSEHTAYIVTKPRLDMVQMAKDGLGELIPDAIDENGDIDIVRLAMEGKLEQYAPYILQSGYVDLESMRREGMIHLVKGIKHTQYGMQVEFYDAQKALELIGKNHALFTDRQEVTGKDGGPIEQSIKHDLSKLDVDELKAMRAMVAKMNDADPKS